MSSRSEGDEETEQLRGNQRIETITAQTRGDDDTSIASLAQRIYASIRGGANHHSINALLTIFEVRSPSMVTSLSNDLSRVRHAQSIAHRRLIRCCLCALRQTPNCDAAAISKLLTFATPFVLRSRELKLVTSLMAAFAMTGDTASIKQCFLAVDESSRDAVMLSAMMRRLCDDGQSNDALKLFRSAQILQCSEH